MANKKKSEKLSDKEIAERIALGKHDMELMKKEFALKPYTMNQSYNLDLRGEQMQWLLKQDVMSNFAKGCILTEVKERENAQTFALFREEVCGGMAQRTAETYMLFAKKCVELKNITAFGEKNWSKVITLLHGSTAEQLKEIEAHGLDGKALDAYDGMSVLDFKRTIKKLQKDTDKIVRAETHTLKVERDSLIKENKELKARLPEKEDITWQLKQFKDVQKKADSFILACRAFVFDERMKADTNVEVGGKVEAVIAEAEDAFRHLKNDWNQLVYSEEFDV